MKNIVNKALLMLLLFAFIGCQKEDDAFIEENLLIETEIDQKSGPSDTRIVCSYEGIPFGFVVEEYLNTGNCPNIDLFLGRFNAAIVTRINTTPNETPIISRAGAGCSDNYCIWIVGSKFEDNAYVDIRTTTGSSIIGTYRGADRNQYVNAQGQDVITLRLKTALEKSEFASRGLRIWVVNPIARKWGDGRTVRRPGGPIEPPCNPNCP